MTGEISCEWQEAEDEMKEKLWHLLKDIIPYLMEHNAEAEACDALMEVEKLEELDRYVDENAYPRVCLYLKR